MPGFLDFGPDPSVSSLPPEVQRCLATPGPGCDQIIGSFASAQGFCGDPSYAQTTYCACVNNRMACPLYSSAVCSNSANAYIPTRMRGADDRCKGATFCTNIVEINGEHNVAENITQQCGTITNITNVIQANPYYATAVFILLVAIAVLFFSRPNDAVRGGVESTPAENWWPGGWL